MSWQQSTTSLAIQLKNLITTPAELTGADLAAFNEARVAVWDLVRTAYSYVVATSRRYSTFVDPLDADAGDIIHELDEWRLNVLGDVAPATPGQLRVSPNSLTRVGSAWRAVGRSAQLANVVWDAAPPEQRPTGRALLPMLADIASVAWAMSRGTTNASPHWATVTSSACPPAVLDHAAIVRSACAAAIPALQKSGGLHTYEDMFPAAIQTTTVESLDQLAGGVRVTGEFLNRQPSMSPAMVGFVVTQHKGTADLIATALTRLGAALNQPSLQAAGRRLTAHAHHLNVGIPRVTDVTTIAPIADAAWTTYRQAGLVFHGAATVLPHVPPTKQSAVALLQAAAYVPTVTTILADLTERHVSTGGWVVRSDRRPEAPNPWTRTDVATHLDLSTQLRSAREDAASLRTELPRPEPSSARRVLQPLVKPRPGLVIPDPTGRTLRR